jgi:hypothetical protein
MPTALWKKADKSSLRQAFWLSLTRKDAARHADTVKLSAAVASTRAATL